MHWFPVNGGSILSHTQLKDAARSLKHLQIEQRWGTLRYIPRVPPDCEGAGISSLRIYSAQQVDLHVSIDINWYRF